MPANIAALDDLWSTKEMAVSIEGNVSFFHCIHDGVTFGERIDRDDVEPAFHDFVFAFHAFPISRFAFPPLFCTIYVDPRTSLANTRIRLKIAFEPP